MRLEYCILHDVSLNTYPMKNTASTVLVAFQLNHKENPSTYRYIY